MEYVNLEPSQHTGINKLEDFHIVRADFIELQKEFADNLIDLLFTDRLWKEHLAIYQDIAKLVCKSIKALRESSFL